MFGNRVFNLHSHPVGSPISQHIHKVDPPMLYVEGSVSTNTSKMGDWNSGHQTSQEANAAVHISYGCVLTVKLVQAVVSNGKVGRRVPILAKI